jgi:hypothetical protein
MPRKNARTATYLTDREQFHLWRQMKAGYELVGNSYVFVLASPQPPAPGERGEYAREELEQLDWLRREDDSFVLTPKALSAKFWKEI